MSRQSDAKLVKAGDLAREIGVTTRTLRYYEDLGLIQPAARSDSGYRLYGRDQATRLRSILRLKDAGFGLEEICQLRELASKRRAEPEAADELSAQIGERTRKVREQISRLLGSLADLEQSNAIVEGCRDCDDRQSDVGKECLDCWRQTSGGDLPAGLEALV